MDLCSITGNQFNLYSRLKDSMLSVPEKIYLCGIVALQLIYSLSGPLAIAKRLPFLPLMMISTYCAVGVIYAWLKYLHVSLQESKLLQKVSFKKKRWCFCAFAIFINKIQWTCCYVTVCIFACFNKTILIFFTLMLSAFSHDYFTPLFFLALS